MGPSDELVVDDHGTLDEEAEMGVASPATCCLKATISACKSANEAI